MKHDQPLTERQVRELAIPCSAQTMKGKPCPNTGARLRNGRSYCRVHDPEGTFRQQVNGRRRTTRPRFPGEITGVYDKGQAVDALIAMHREVDGIRERLESIILTLTK
jgi:hypothetical protein